MGTEDLLVQARLPGFIHASTDVRKRDCVSDAAIIQTILV